MSIRPLILAATAAAALAAPAAAQDAPAGTETYNTVIIYGDDACPVSDGDTITVCARMDESERYRIPPNLRQSENPANQSWSDRVRSFETVGDWGTMACNNIGGAAELGCTMEMIEAAYADKENAPGVRFSQLINQARQERLETIDAETAETQRRVEELEEAYMARLRAESEAPLPGEEAPAEVVDPADMPAPGTVPPPPQ